MTKSITKLLFFLVFLGLGISALSVPIVRSVYWKSPPVVPGYITWRQVVATNAYPVYWALFYPCILLVESAVMSNTRLSGSKLFMALLMVLQSLLVFLGAILVLALYFFCDELPGLFVIMGVCATYGLLGIVMAFPKFKLRKILFPVDGRANVS
jgi:hypothetical protein